MLKPNHGIKILGDQAILFFLFLVATAAAFAQAPKLRFQHLGTQEGLSTTTVHAIVQDADGFMWFGTEDGLNKYDGYNFTVYKHRKMDSTTLSNSAINTLLVDRMGGLWIGTIGGLNYFDKSEGVFHSIGDDTGKKGKLPDKRVRAVYEDKTGNIWIGTEKGLSKLNRSTNIITNFKDNPLDIGSLHGRTVYSICGGSGNVIWFGTDEGLSKYDPNTNTFKNFKIGAKRNDAFHVCWQPPGIIWIGTYDGLIKFIDPANTYQSIKIQSDLSGHSSENKIGALCLDNGGFLWVGTDNGLNCYNPATNIFYPYRQNMLDRTSLSSNTIDHIFIGRSNILWAASPGGGINYALNQQQQFEIYQNDAKNVQTLSANRVYSVFEDSDQDIWIGTNGGGVNRMNKLDHTFISFQKSGQKTGGLISNIIFSICEYGKGKIWLGTDAGICILDKKTGKVIADNNNTAIKAMQSWVLCMHKDRNGILRIGTLNGGLYSYDDVTGKLQQFLPDKKNPNSINSNIVFCITEDKDGILWIGTNAGGVNRYDPKTKIFKAYTSDSSANSLSNNQITSITDDDKYLWVTTPSGLNKFDKSNGTSRIFDEDNGLPDNMIYSALKDDAGNLWISSNKGICKFNEAKKLIKNFDINDGLPDNEFNQGAYFRGHDGKMYFGGIKGFVTFYPAQIKENTHIPPMVLTSFKVFNKEFDLDKPINETEEIQLQYNDNAFSFEYAALDFASPVKNQYAYLLEGFDKEWNYVGNRRNVSYTKLDPGTYYFRVIGSNNDGNWNETGKKIKIVISPAYWQTSWFRVLAAIGIFGLFFGFYYQHINRLQSEKKAQEDFSRRLIESQEKERKRIAGELHDSLGQNLLIIKNSSDQIMLSGDLNFISNESREISGLAKESIQEVREIAYNLHPYQLERLGLTKAIESMINKIKNSEAVKINHSLTKIDNLVSKELEINIYRLVQESFNNILKHSKASEASINIEMVNKKIEIEIEDNGGGFDVEKIKSNGKAGFGLQGLAERTRIFNGSLAIGSVIGLGTTVKISIPIPDGVNG